MKKLIINADDFGISEGVTLGIIKAHQNGVVTSTTAMMNMPYVKRALEMAKALPDLGVGIHLVLTTGSPMCENVPSMVDEAGDFQKLRGEFDHCQVDLVELEKEWETQIRLFIELAGRKPSHIDSHHHVHLRKNLIDVALKLARKYDIPMRQTCEDLTEFEPVCCFDKMYDDDVNLEYLSKHIQNGPEFQEVMCHPGFLDKDIYEKSSYNISRMYELDFYQSEQLKSYLKENFELINFNNIAKRI